MGCGNLLNPLDPFGLGEKATDALGIPHGPEMLFNLNFFETFKDIKQDWVTFKHLLVPDMRRDREVQAQSATNSRTIIYGRTRVGNQFTYAETTGDKSQIFHIICVHAGHEIDGYEEIYFDDKLVANSSGVQPVGWPGAWISGSWSIQAPYTDKTTIEFFDGTQTAACTSMIAASAGGWTSAHKLLGVAYTHIALTYDETAFPAGLPTVKAVIRGKRVLDTRTGLIAWSSNPAMCIRDYMLTPVGFGGMGCDTDEINEPSFVTAANICDEVVFSYIPPNQTPGTKTLIKPIVGVSLTYPETRYTLNGEIKLDGAPTQFVKSMLTSCAGEGVYTAGQWKIFAGAPIASVATIDESWLNGGISFQTGANKNDKINTAKGTFINSNDYWADSEFPSVPIGVSTPPNASYWNVTATPLHFFPNSRYVIDGGHYSYIENEYATLAGKVYKCYNKVPTTETPSGSGNWVSTPPPGSSYWVLVEEYDAGLIYPINHVIQRASVVYTSNAIVPAANAYIAEDGGEVLTANLVLPFTIFGSEAQRLAKITLEKSRRGLTVSYPCNHKAFKFDVMDVIKVNNTRLGWVEKQFRVVAWPFSLMGGVALSLAEYDPNVFTWNAGDSTPLVPPIMTNLPDPTKVIAPSNLVLTPQIYDYNSGTSTRVDLNVAWNAGGPWQLRYELQYRVAAGTWSEIVSVGMDLTYTISTLNSANYEVRVRGINSIGAASDWISGTVFVPLPDTTVPNVTGLELFGQGNNVTFVGKDINLRWNYVSPRGDTTLVGPGRGSSWFKYYIVKVYTTGGVLRRTDYTTTENYTYTYDMNRKDGIDVAIRNVRFDVTILTSWNAESAVPATITVNNPNIVALSSLTLTGAVNLLSVALPLPSEGDFTGFLVHASQTANFTPDASNQINKGGPETVVTKINMTPGTWYVKAAGYDSFGTDGANYSAQYQVNVDSLTVTPELLDSIQRVDFYIRNSNFYFTTSTLNWSAGYIDRDTTTYTLAAGTMATANTSYIIATCDAGVVTLSKVAVGTGLPSLATNQVVIALTSDYTTPQGNYYCYVRQANSVAIEGALIRNATITDAHITGTLSANRIQSLNGATQISGAGITLNDYSNDLIQIGGRNLLLNSDFGKATPPAGCTISNGKATFTSVALGQSIILSLSMSPQFLKLLAGDLFIGSARFSLSNIVAGPTNFWLGCELAITYSDATHDWIDIGGGNSLGVGTKSEFLQSNNSYTIPAGKIIYQVDCTIIMRDCTGTFTVQSPKWEEGNKATSWTPAPEDVDSSIATAATTANWSGIDVPIRFADAPVGAGLCITPTYMGYYNGSAWKTYQDNQGNLYLSGDNGRGLTWTAATSQLDIISGSTTGKRVSISGSDNEIHFFDDIGNGTIGEMVTLGAFSADGSGLYARTSYGIKSTSTYPYQYAPIVGEYISSRFGGSGILGKSSGTQGVGGVDLAGGIGVRGKSSSGYGIFGECNSGYGIGAMLGYYVGPTWYECKGPIYLQPSKVSGAPTHSANSGTIWVTPETDTPPCVMYVNISSPSPGTTWQKVGAQ